MIFLAALPTSPDIAEPERLIVLLRTSMFASWVENGLDTDLVASTRQIPFAPAPERTVLPTIRRKSWRRASHVIC